MTTNPINTLQASPADGPIGNSGSVSLWQRLRQLPRVVRWGLCGGGLIVVLLIYNDYVLATATAWDAQAQTYQETLDRAALLKRDEAGLRGIGSAIAIHGPIRVPPDEAVAAAAFKQAVIEILGKYTVTHDSFLTDAGGKLKRGTMQSIVGAGEARFIRGMLDFESNVDVAIKLISDLESHPAIDAITSLRITKPKGEGDTASRQVRVRLTLSAWAISSSTSTLKVEGP